MKVEGFQGNDSASILRYRPYNAGSQESRPTQPWTIVNDITTTEYTLEELLYGEHYEIEVDSVANKIYSQSPLKVKKTIVPQSVGNVEPILDAENVNLEWTRPEGRVDQYLIKWYPLSYPEDIHEKELTGVTDVEGVVGQKVSVLIEELHPGLEYVFEITNEANLLRYWCRTHP